MLFANLMVDEEGRRLLRLRKTHDGLCRFLTGKGSWSSPLAESAVFETLRLRRNLKIQALAAEAFEGGTGAGQPAADDDEGDQMALLGVDEAAAFEAVRPVCQRTSGCVGIGPYVVGRRLSLSASSQGLSF